MGPGSAIAARFALFDLRHPPDRRPKKTEGKIDASYQGVAQETQGSVVPQNQR
jgi:hypothetical protein